MTPERSARIKGRIFPAIEGVEQLPPRRKLTRAEAGRLGGLQAAHNLGKDGLKRRAANGGKTTLERHGKALYVRLNYVKKGLLPGGPQIAEK